MLQSQPFCLIRRQLCAAARHPFAVIVVTAGCQHVNIMRTRPCRRRTQALWMLSGRLTSNCVRGWDNRSQQCEGGFTFNDARRMRCNWNWFSNVKMSSCTADCCCCCWRWCRAKTRVSLGSIRARPSDWTTHSLPAADKSADSCRQFPRHCVGPKLSDGIRICNGLTKITPVNMHALQADQLLARYRCTALAARSWRAWRQNSEDSDGGGTIYDNTRWWQHDDWIYETCHELRGAEMFGIKRCKRHDIDDQQQDKANFAWSLVSTRSSRYFNRCD